ncbi:MAG: hypothetical protein HY711_08575 [Candidatus Melainabacteria bacterium]|nr:hypothetical protein [Candidatus Melainabacteria bacterium]
MSNPATRLLLDKLESLRNRLSKTVSEVREKLKETRLSEDTRKALETQLQDLFKSIQEIDALETRLKRL